MRKNDGTPLPSALDGVIAERIIKIDSALLYLINGALSELVSYEGLEQTGSLTVEDAKSALSDMFTNYFTEEVMHQVFPTQALMTFADFQPVGQATGTTITPATVEMGALINPAPLVVNTAMQSAFFIAAGTWNVQLCYQARVLGCRDARILIDDNEIGVLNMNTNQPNAGLKANYTVTLNDPGVHTLKINAASGTGSNFEMRVQYARVYFDILLNGGGV